jgi:hypothetical protein
MATEQRIYHLNKIGWFIELPDRVEGPLESRQEAVDFANLLRLVGMARSGETACTEQDCF